MSPRESTATAEASASVPAGHNVTNESCIVCHLRPATHEIDPFTCGECHEYNDWTTAAHPKDTDCAGCHTKPGGHVSTSDQCSACHKNAGFNWNFRHPDSANCTDCHTAPKNHFGADCTRCHDPSIAWSATQYPHTNTLRCAECHTRPHRSYAATCIACHPKVGISWKFGHPTDSLCQNCHTPPAGHFGNNCSVCHTPSIPWKQTPMVHSAGTTRCAECHTPPHRADYPVACTSCHTRPGVTWLPAVHTTSGACSSCHAAPAVHVAGQCSLCHDPRIPFANTGHPGTASPCASCHTPPHRADYPVACASCHPSVGVAWTPVVHTANTGCVSCHPAPVTHYGTNCSGCHDPSVPFADTVVIHGPSTTVCLDCHERPHVAYPVDCIDCHNRPGVAWQPVVHTSSTLCSSCHTRPAGHPDGQCSDCHDPSIPFADTQHPGAASTCTSCHTPLHRADYPVVCASCHPNVGVAWLPPVHTDSTDCAACHTAPSPHYGTSCNSCHSPGVPFLDATVAHGPGTTECQTCHTPPHGSYAPSVCSDCHKSAGISWAVTHPSRTDCAACHAGVTVDTHPFSGCEDCHDHGYVVEGGSHGSATPTAAGCGSSFPGTYCHNVQHYYNNENGIWGSGPFSCTYCHSAAFPGAPQLNGVIAPLQSQVAPLSSAATMSESALDPTATPGPGSDLASRSVDTSAEPAPVIGNHDPTDARTPRAPSGVSASPQGANASVSWNAETGVLYEVQEGSESGFGNATTAWSGPGGSTELGSFSAGSQVWFRVRARAGGNGDPSPWSAAVSVEFPKDEKAPAPPAAPEKDGRVPEKDDPTPVAEKAPAPPDDPEPPAADPKPEKEPEKEPAKPDPPAPETPKDSAPADAPTE